MKRYRPLIFFGLALLLAFVTSILVFSWMQNEKNRLMAAPILVKHPQVVVANADLAWGTKLTPEMVQIQELPAEMLPEGHFTSLEAIKDRVLLIDIKRNELLMESKLAPLGTTSGGVAGVTDVNKRAMSVKVDDVIGVAGFIKPGDRVDVMVTIEPESGKQAHAISKMILENVKVLAAGTQMERKGKDEEPVQVQVITVEVDVEEAEKLALASTQGRLRLALRNPMNSERVLTKGANVGALLSSFRPKQAPKKTQDGEGVIRVEIIKGDVRKELKF